ncbi:MAG: alpha/beta hydrolase [Draconibacterium sp.]|nr:alpha/beta hydrolase [Draconibacterium sp.]
MRLHIFILILLLGAGIQSLAQTFKVETSKMVYKQVNGNQLEMTMYKPIITGSAKLPAIVFFFGGGWVSGTPGHFKMQAEYLASRGIIAFCPDYRVKNRHKTTPFESVKDARTAMRYLKVHGEELGVDTDRIVASGGSAGGHLAACTAIIDEINEDTDDLNVTISPFALVLFNPVVDTGKKGYGSEKVKGREFEISPVHHITPGVPPTLIVHGKDDTTVPYENVQRFCHVMKQQGNSCKLKGYRNQTHGFFNFSKKPKYFKKTLQQTEKFLENLELLKGDSWIDKYYKTLGEV